jgi:photosystem II stability/assembly factor-like uncharacterized protein
MRHLAAVLIVVPLSFLAGCTEEAEKPPELWIAGELGTRAEFRDVFFLDADRGWIVGGGHGIGGGILGSTTDGGRTWRFRSGIARPDRRASSFHLNAIRFVDDRIGFIVGDGYVILRTVDGGEHWHGIKSNRRVWAHLSDLQFVDRNHGWTIGEGGLARTTDGGATWEGPLTVDPEAGDSNITRGRALHFVDRDRGWLVGRFGLIRFTTDGGKSWTRIGGAQASEKPDLRGLDFADDLHGWAVGEHGAILHTADGGKTWNPQASGVRDVLVDVDFIDTARGWVVGFNSSTGSSTVLYTDNGGTTWTEQARVGSELMQALFALDHRHAWAVGEQRRLSDADGTQKLLRYVVDSTE